MDVQDVLSWLPPLYYVILFKLQMNIKPKSKPQTPWVYPNDHSPILYIHPISTAYHDWGLLPVDFLGNLPRIIHQYQTQQLNDIDKLKPRTVLSFFVEDLQILIQLAPFLQYEINKRSQISNCQGKLIRQYTQRQLAFTPKPHITTNNLTEEHTHI